MADVVDINDARPIPKDGHFDAIIIGAGHNGLTAAAYLGKAGLRVCVLEARHQIGGMAGHHDIEPGFRVPHCAHHAGQFSPQIIRDLQLTNHGLKWAQKRGATHYLAPHGAPFTLESRGGWFKQKPKAGFGADKQSALGLIKRLGALAQTISPLLTMPPVWSNDAKSGWRMSELILTNLPAADRRLLFSLTTASIQDVLEPYIEDPILLGAIAFEAVMGSGVSPTQAGSALPWLYRLALQNGYAKGETLVPEGGVGELCQALARAADSHGVLVQTGKPVAAIKLIRGEVKGVVLKDGQEVKAPIVLSSLDPQTTYLGLIGERALDIDMVRRLKRWRATGRTAKINMSLLDLPDFADKGVSRFVFAQTTEIQDHANRYVKRGLMPPEFGFEVVIPTVQDKTLAPEGQHVLSAIVEPVPYLRGEPNERLRTEIQHRVMARLDEVSPGFGTILREAEVMTPFDLEEAFGAPSGHWHHGDLSLDQIWSNRPAPGQDMRRVLPGIELCGAGAHPGGGVTGLPGLIAAQRVLAEAEAA